MRVFPSRQSSVAGGGNSNQVNNFMEKILYWKSNIVARLAKIFPALYEDQSVVAMFKGPAICPHPVPNEFSPYSLTRTF
jgi:hypothetical protein